MIIFVISVNTMPGHIKKTDGPDPDPSPWLIVSDELMVKLKSKPYDPKKSCWVPDKATGGYWEGLIDSADGDKISVKLLESGDVSILLSYIFFLTLQSEISTAQDSILGQSIQEGPSSTSQSPKV